MGQVPAWMCWQSAVGVFLSNLDCLLDPLGLVMQLGGSSRLRASLQPNGQNNKSGRERNKNQGKQAPNLPPERQKKARTSRKKQKRKRKRDPLHPFWRSTPALRKIEGVYPCSCGHLPQLLRLVGGESLANFSRGFHMCQNRDSCPPKSRAPPKSGSPFCVFL